MATVRKKNSAKERWTFEQVAIALLQADPQRSRGLPTIWLKEAEELTDKLLEAIEDYGHTVEKRK